MNDTELKKLCYFGWILWAVVFVNILLFAEGIIRVAGLTSSALALVAITIIILKRSST